MKLNLTQRLNSEKIDGTQQLVENWSLMGDSHTRQYFTQRMIVCTALWSLLELPLELFVSLSSTEIVAAVLGEAIWLIVAIFTLGGNQFAKKVFAFCCAISALSIGFGLEAEEKFFQIGFYVSIIECTLKIVTLALLLWPIRKRVRSEFFYPITK